MILEKTKWENIKKFANNKRNFRAKDIPCGYTGKVYVNYLHKAGFLTRTKKGHYSLNLNLTKELSIGNVKDFAYGKRKYQLIKLIRKIKLNKIKKYGLGSRRRYS